MSNSSRKVWNLQRQVREYDPDVRDDIGTALLRLDRDGEYTLLYQVENYGDVACTVGVRECEDGEAASS